MHRTLIPADRERKGFIVANDQCEQKAHNRGISSNATYQTRVSTKIKLLSNTLAALKAECKIICSSSCT